MSLGGSLALLDLLEPRLLLLPLKAQIPQLPQDFCHILQHCRVSCARNGALEYHVSGPCMWYRSLEQLEIRQEMVSTPQVTGHNSAAWTKPRVMPS